MSDAGAAGTVFRCGDHKQAAPGRLTVQADGELAAEDESGPPEWTLDALAAEARRLGIEVGRSQVRRILLAEGVRWRRTRSWTRSKDPDFDLAVGEWITDAPPHVLEHGGVRLDPLSPKRALPAETTVRRLLARIDGDALDPAVGRWLSDRRNQTQGRPSGLAVDGKSLRGAAR
ncbi:transposase family protein [Streptomyces sp. NBC_00289]|uniref:transposase family protein n=1 Tax=Streptomyces sp. NBC_00289 TaxID=2975703 RepID=UPI003248AC2D